jgi:hypothetical protein
MSLDPAGTHDPSPLTSQQAQNILETAREYAEDPDIDDKLREIILAKIKSLKQALSKITPVTGEQKISQHEAVGETAQRRYDELFKCLDQIDHNP